MKHIAVDDNTSQIVGAHISKEETLESYFQVLINYGIPYHIKTDKRTVGTPKIKKKVLL